MEVVHNRLLLGVNEERHMKVIGEFLCRRGGAHTLELTTSDSDRKVIHPVEKARQRKWIVQKIYLDKAGLVNIDKWAVKSYVDYMCRGGKCAKLGWACLLIFGTRFEGDVFIV